MAALGDRLLRADGSPSWLARGSVPFSTYQQPASLTLIDGRPVSFANLYETQPWVGAAVNLLSRQVARLPLKVYRVTDRDGNRERVRPGSGSPLADALAAPYNGRSSTDLKAKVMSGLLVHGNRLLRKVRDPGGAVVLALDPLDWRYVTPHFDAAGSIVAWEYRPADGVAWLDPADVVHLRWETPDGCLGLSPLAQLGITARSEDAAQRYADALLRSPRVGLAAVLDKTVTADEAVRNGLRSELQIAHGEVDNAGAPAILGGGVTDLKTIPSQTAVEAELIDQRRLNREEVAAVYAIPQPILGILDKATYSNFDQAHQMLYQTVLGPWLTLVADQFAAQLIEAEAATAGRGLFVEFDVSEMLKGAPRDRAAAYRDFLAAGALTINDIRRRENETPFTNPLADEPMIAANNLAPLGTAATPPPAAALAALIADEVHRTNGT